MLLTSVKLFVRCFFFIGIVVTRDVFCSPTPTRWPCLRGPVPVASTCRGFLSPGLDEQDFKVLKALEFKSYEICANCENQFLNLSSFLVTNVCVFNSSYRTDGRHESSIMVWSEDLN